MDMAEARLAMPYIKQLYRPGNVSASHPRGRQFAPENCKCRLEVIAMVGHHGGLGLSSIEPAPGGSHTALVGTDWAPLIGISLGKVQLHISDLYILYGHLYYAFRVLSYEGNDGVLPRSTVKVASSFVF